ncbi:hypothetical protein GCM10011574_01460 [Microbispora bryophytorum]|uniref:Uncharacterized protein n=2 Tax=Microbispora bryophytorum TaxID=1460882 RepID=A0A8H9L846_9ACTN|nr:hypothetical protein GCM10011574_01460 [Microbispora bryophytorum]
MVTSSASTVMAPFTSRPSMTVPSLVTVIDSDGRSFSPLGTPVLSGPGQAAGRDGEGAGLGVVRAVGVVGGVGRPGPPSVVAWHAVCEVTSTAPASRTAVRLVTARRTPGRFRGRCERTGMT